MRSPFYRPADPAYEHDVSAVAKKRYRSSTSSLLVALDTHAVKYSRFSSSPRMQSLCSTSPDRYRTLHVPHRPARHDVSIGTPASSSASAMLWSAVTGII